MLSLSRSRDGSLPRKSAPPNLYDRWPYPSLVFCPFLLTTPAAANSRLPMTALASRPSSGPLSLNWDAPTEYAAGASAETVMLSFDFQRLSFGSNLPALMFTGVLKRWRQTRKSSVISGWLLRGSPPLDELLSFCEYAL